MSRPARNLSAAQDLGDRAVTARDAWFARNGEVSDGRIASAIYGQSGVYMTHAALKKLWAGEMDPNSVMIETILAIARFLEVDPDDFGPVIAQRRRQVAALALGEETPGFVGAGDGNRTRVLSLGS